jgi:plastocyanin
MRRALLALIAGVLAAMLVAGFPAVASNQTVAAQSNSTWSHTSVSINVGETVTWTNPDGGFHNVCVAKPGDPAPTADNSTCTEFRNGDAGADWSSYENAHMFSTAGSYQFICQIHGGSGMTGTITVGSGGGTTTTQATNTQTQTQTTPAQTTPTQTTPTQTQTTITESQPAADTTAPRFTGRLKRRSSRKALIIDLGSSEAAKLKATVSRRAPGKRTFSKVGQASVDVDEGRNVVKLPRKASGKLRTGAYKVKLVLVDAAGNSSAAKTLQFKLGG